MQVEIVPFKANIYRLYQRLKEYGFDYDVKRVLVEQNPSEEARAVLSQKFAYTYLVFDCDAQNRGVPPKGSSPQDVEDVVAANYSIVGEMARYFVDETDPDRGKLYVNYPMMESYRDADSFNDESFVSQSIAFSELSHYKERVNRRRLSRYHADNMSRGEIDSLTRMHLRKLNFMMRGEDALPEISQYESICLQAGILDRQRSRVGESQMHVINTSLFLPVDYFGMLPQ